MKEAITFDDVLIVPARSAVLPKDVSLKTRFTQHLPLNIPVVSAAMDTVTEHRTAIALAREGGIGVIHRNMSEEKQATEVRKVKRAEYYIVEKPITITPETTIGEIVALATRYGISSFPVVENNKLVGIVTKRDVRFEHNMRRKAKSIMTKKLITAQYPISMNKAKQILHENRIEKLPLVDKHGRLKGLITSIDIEKKEKFPYALKDKKGRLMVAAAIGPKDDYRVKVLMEAEVDALVIDTAHGHSKNVLNAVKRIKKDYDVELVAGNVATKEGAQDLVAAGADAIKVGVGPGAICTTRVVTGVGMPQITAIMEAVKGAGNIPVIADGGITYSGDIAKAIAAGADSVMMGAIFAGCEETPGRIIYLNNRKFKEYRGMGSISAMQRGSADRYMQTSTTKPDKLVPEGVEGIVPYKGTVSEVVFQLMGGVRSAMGMVGAKTIPEFKKRAKFVRITQASVRESHPHDIKITSEAPNYP